MADVEMNDAPVPKVDGANGKSVEGKKKFEVKKVRTPTSVGLEPADAYQWNAVALWAWDIVVDNCAICRNHIMDLCWSLESRRARKDTNGPKVLSAKRIRRLLRARSAQWLGGSATCVSTIYIKRQIY